MNLLQVFDCIEIANALFETVARDTGSARDAVFGRTIVGNKKWKHSLLGNCAQALQSAILA